MKPEQTAFWEYGIVIELGEFSRADGENARGNFVIRLFEEALQARDGHAFHALDGLRGRDQPAEVDALPEGEVVRVEEASPAAREGAIAERIQHRRFDVRLQVIRQKVDGHFQRERNVLALDHGEIVTDPTIAPEVYQNLAQQFRIGIVGACGIDGARTS